MINSQTYRDLIDTHRYQEAAALRDRYRAAYFLPPLRREEPKIRLLRRREEDVTCAQCGKTVCTDESVDDGACALSVVKGWACSRECYFMALAEYNEAELDRLRRAIYDE